MDSQQPVSTPLYTVPTNQNGPSAILWRNVGGCVFLALLLMMTCTQYLAYTFGYQAALGDPIIALGSFKLSRSQPARSSAAKRTGRPLDLLKVLVANGGEGVKLERAAEALWPHVEAALFPYASTTSSGPFPSPRNSIPGLST